jgi:hypothetical protein
MTPKRIIGAAVTGWGLPAFACLTALACLAVAPTHAEDLAGGKPLRIHRIDAQTCRDLAPYVSSGEADFKPGVAADGTAVAPADVDGGYVYEPRRVFHFPVEIEPLAGTGLPYEHSRMEVASVTFDALTGRVTVDGQDVSGGDRALYEACAYKGGNATPR